MRRVWERGPRTFVQAKDQKGKTMTLLGKNGGPVIKQSVVMCLVPRNV